MKEIEIGADELIAKLLLADDGRGLCILDSCGVGKKDSNLLIAGIDPVQTIALPAANASESLAQLDQLVSSDDLAAIFTLSYDIGRRLCGIEGHDAEDEPGIFASLFDSLLIHDYDAGRTYFAGNPLKLTAIDKLLDRRVEFPDLLRPDDVLLTPVSNFSLEEYIEAVEAIQELIRAGETYQTNLTQQLTVNLSTKITAQGVFANLRRDHPAPFAAFIDRGDSAVVSASPEQFLRIESCGTGRRIIAEPIKGTRRRGLDMDEDDKLKAELLSSAKDRAENTMIVDLMRNDLGRICEFGTVDVEELCRIEEHPTLFHLVSTVSGTLRENIRFADIIRAVFPCGSITGAPKLRTMEIIDRLETRPRGLSMGAIGCRIPGATFGAADVLEMSVAIRTMVFHNKSATFNVGGGIVIDSDPEQEFEESLLKAKALLRALQS